MKINKLATDGNSINSSKISWSERKKSPLKLQLPSVAKFVSLILWHFYMVIRSFIIALNISKIFDRVWRKSLLTNLPSYSFPPSICTLLLNHLSNINILQYLSVLVYGSVSPPQPINSGVPLGCVLSLTLFHIFINDLLSMTSCP